MSLKHFKSTHEPTEYYAKIKALWAEFHEHREYSLPERKVINTSLLERLADDANTLFLILDTYNFKISYIGKNVEQFIGYSIEEFSELGASLFFKILKKEHQSFFVKILDWAKDVRDKIPFEAKKEFMTYSICGMTIQNKNGRDKRMFIRVYPIEITPAGFVDLALVELEDITNLLKTDNYWVRAAAGKTEIHALTFFSEESKKNTSLISERELEVLKLISEGYQTKEIADRLFISTNTVEKHRKNMIARVGVIDTVALTEICKRCGIL